MENCMLVSAALSLLEDKYDPANHRVVCIAHSEAGLHSGIHLNSSGLDVCAESIAIANARLAGALTIDWIVSITLSGSGNGEPCVVTPCGNCRQLLIHYCPNAQVVIGMRDGELRSILAKELLPSPYVKPLYGTQMIRKPE